MTKISVVHRLHGHARVPNLVMLGILLLWVLNAFANVSGAQNVVVLRVYFQDYTNTSRYTKTQVEGFFTQLDTLWGTNNSYGNITLNAQVSDLYQLPSNRSDYIDDFADGDLSNGGKYSKVLTDAVANSPAGIDWSNVQGVVVVMAETDPAQFHRGQGNKCTLKMGPAAGAVSKLVGCAIFSENPSETDMRVWGRWGHEIGHALQEGDPPHPSNYNSNFELMDALYPGQTGMFEKWVPGGFGGWMPRSKYRVFTPATGGGTVAVFAEEQRPGGKPNWQAIKADITSTLYYIVSVRRAINGDDLRPIPDEGVLIERVVENGDTAVGGSPWVVLQGKAGNRDQLWQEGDSYQNVPDGIYIDVTKKVDQDNYEITVRYSDGSNQPDVGIYFWRSPPGNTWETTDIWVDSPVNGYDTYRYGTWSDLHGGTVPVGNGDDPAVGQVNRLYARVRNFGTLPAQNVVVHFDITDPPGLGIGGSNGFVELGAVSATQFPGLASIPAGGYVDVYLDWTPNFAVTEEQLAAGRFAFHTCVRVRIDHLPSERVFSNQDGDGTQENIGYFEATGGPGAPLGAPIKSAIRIRNDDRANKKYFYINYKHDLPAGWMLDVNGGASGLVLAPGEVRDIPVNIKQTSRQPYGSKYFVEVFASSQHVLVSDRDKRDKHIEFKTLGGVRIETRVVAKTKLSCTARKTSGGVVVSGRLSGLPKGEKAGELAIYVIGVEKKQRLNTKLSALGMTRADGRFGATVRTKDHTPQSIVCMFAGTDILARASSGYVLIR